MGKPVTERSKVVIKNLPPSLSEETFLAALNGVCHGTFNALRYVPGRQSAKGIRPSRAYLYMNEPLLVYDLRASFDGHSFVNERGQQYQCTVEYAPYQKAPKIVTKKDPREGTLDKDPGYQDFLEQLEKDPFSLRSKAVEAVDTSQSQPSAGGKKVSALMLYLQKKWAGTLDPASEGRKARQRGKSRKTEDRSRGPANTEATDVTTSTLEPPPGFASLQAPAPTSATTPASKKAKQAKKGGAQEGAKSRDAKQQAKSAGHQEGPKPSKKGQEKPSKAGQAESQRVTGSSQAPSSAAEASKPRQTQGNAAQAPKRILKKESSQTAAEADPEKKEQGPRKQATRQKEDAEAQKQRASKPVRAGYQPYTPKSRSTS